VRPLPDLQLDPQHVLAAFKARTGKQVADLIEEVAHLEAYIAALTAENAELKTRPDAWGDQPEPQ